MQYKNAVMENIIAHGKLQNILQAGKLQIFNGRASCKFSLYISCKFFNMYKLQILHLQPRAVKRR